MQFVPGLIRLHFYWVHFWRGKSRRLSRTKVGEANADPIGRNPGEGRKIAYGSFPAGDGRDSPLKYTSRRSASR